MKEHALFWVVAASLALGCGGGGKPGGGSGGAGEETGGEGGDGTGGSTGGASGTVKKDAGPATGGAPGTGGSATGGTGSGGSAGSGGTGGGAGEPDAGSTTADSGSPPASDGGATTFAIPPGMTQIFDGKTLTGWTGSAIWTVDAAEGAIHGKTGGPGGQLLKSAGDYDDFRVVVTEKAVATTNHMGLCFWGTRPGNGYGGCLDVIPPSGHLWDYGGGGDVPNTGVGSANNPIKFMWHQVEILATASTGEVLVAVNGKQVTTYKKAGRARKGPFGLQAHAGASDQMYKEIWIEPNPKERKLITVK
jgi:hypothetical protein